MRSKATPGATVKSSEESLNLERSNKKPYVSPRLVDQGNIDDLTRRGGSSVTDVPIGTPVDDDISNVAS